MIGLDPAGARGGRPRREKPFRIPPHVAATVAAERRRRLTQETNAELTTLGSELAALPTLTGAGLRHQQAALDDSRRRGKVLDSSTRWSTWSARWCCWTRRAASTTSRSRSRPAGRRDAVPELCAFNPLHGRSSGRPTKVEADGTTLTLPLCTECRQALKRGKAPASLPGDDGPYWYDDILWARTFFGTTGDDLAAAVSRGELRPLTSGFPGTGSGAPRGICRILRRRPGPTVERTTWAGQEKRRTMAESKQLGVILLVAAAGLAFWQFGDRDSDDDAPDRRKITTVQLAAEHADVTIKVSDDDKTTVQEKRTYWFWKHGDAYSVNDGVLKLDGDCGWQCSADFVVTVPRGTKVTGENGSGDLSIAGVSGVDAKSRSGKIELRDVTGDVKLDLTSGDVIGDLTGKLDVKANSGDIEAIRSQGRRGQRRDHLRRHRARA